MGSTKSKVDYSDEVEDSPSVSQSTESVHKKAIPKHHEVPKRRHSSRKRRSSDKARSTIGSDDILTKPFTYQSRKERLLKSLVVSEDENRGDSNKEYDDSDDAMRESKAPSCVQKIVSNIQANLNAQCGSSASMRKDQRRRSRSKSPQPASDYRRSSACRVKTGKVKPTGVEEKIIETLIKPRDRQNCHSRGIRVKDSSDSIGGQAHRVKAAYDDDRAGYCKQKRPPSPPQPPPIDFSDGTVSEDDTTIGKETETEKTQYAPPETLPLHLKELKLKFSNDVPRSPYEDNLHDSNLCERFDTSKQREGSARNVFKVKHDEHFSNDVPLSDSLHILSSIDKPPNSSPKVVVRGAKNSAKKKDSADHRSKGFDKNECPRNDSELLLGEKQWTRDKGHKNTPLIMNGRASGDDDIIKCFQVKTEYDPAAPKHPKKHGSPREKRRERRQHGHNDQGHNSQKTVRTQTSMLGLYYGSPNKQDAEIQYDSAIESNAQRILRRVSRDRNCGRDAIVKDDFRKESGKRKYKNSSTQWEDIDLLDSSSCSFVRDSDEDRGRRDGRREKKRVSRISGKSKSETRIDESRDGGRTSGKDNKREACRMHIQKEPSVRKDKSSRKSKLGLELLANKPRLSRFDRTSSREETPQQFCGKCSTSHVTSEERLSLQAVYSASSARSRDLNLLSPFNSIASFRNCAGSPASNSGGKNEDIYRQMEELGLGFVRNGEWVPTDVLTRSVWKNLEKCSENCQATWRRRSRSYTNTKTHVELPSESTDSL